MGSCLGKHKPKRNSVCPSNMETEIRQRKSTKKASGQREQHSINETEMKKQLEDADAGESKITKGGVAFTLDFNEGDPMRMPSRLADRLDGVASPLGENEEIQYTSEERELLAELFRDDILREKSEKASTDKKAYAAARRRAEQNT